MVNREISKKVLALAFSIILIILVFSVLIPPAAGVELTIGGRSPSSVTVGGTITFTDVNITIEAIERIPFVELNFTIFNSAHSEVASVQFMVNATEKSGSDTNNRFTISLEEPNSTVLESWHTTGQGYDISYGYYWGSTNGTGYGYGSTSGIQITISYTIIYTTHTTGSGFYGKLFGNATMNSQTVIYNSSASPTFNVKSKSSSSGGGGSSNIAPTADAGGPYTGAVGQTIVLSAAGSSDTDGTLNGYKWDFTNDGVYDTDWLTTATTSHSYGSPGTYTVK
ncbi:MAG: PKD domain-containing protein, partial [Candidatus Thermoplasmatota archaeon]|nr:PKD domain-containing protein [Candidatus Thermoplasmatota archaeon]